MGHSAAITKKANRRKLDQYFSPAAIVGVAMLLRLSYLEPTKDRGHWLNDHPPTQMIVLPRISFTGDGKTDSVTCAWMIWHKQGKGTITIERNPKFEQHTS